MLGGGSGGASGSFFAGALGAGTGESGLVTAGAATGSAAHTGPASWSKATKSAGAKRWRADIRKTWFGEGPSSLFRYPKSPLLQETIGKGAPRGSAGRTLLYMTKIRFTALKPASRRTFDEVCEVPVQSGVFARGS
jgi:hypothetical protein